MERGTRIRARYSLQALLLAFCLFIAFVGCVELGRRIGVHQLRAIGEGARAGVGVIDGAVFGLLSLLLGFSFSGAAARFDKRRELVAAEANAIGTAWQRIETLVTEQQHTLRPLFIRYFDELLEFYRNASGTDDPLRESPALTNSGNALWTSAVALCLTQEGDRARMLLLPSLNEMFGAVERERLARRIHPPKVIFAMLAIIALAAALFGGYEMSNAPARNWLYIIGVAFAISFATYVIAELEYPRLGFVRIDSMDRALTELRQSLQPQQL